MPANRFARIIRTFNTLRHLRLLQLFYFVWRRGIGARRVPATTALARPRLSADRQQLHDAAPDHADRISGHRFSFLNRTLEFAVGDIDWCPPGVNRLWRYNLHYFDYLSDPQRSRAEKMELLDSWIKANPQGTEPAWEPYTASLRIVNWCRFLSSLPTSALQPHWLNSLHEQTRWLEKNLELHILANHYFENIKALLFAGVFFDDARAQRWLRRFQRELLEQLHEQTLADGGHYERTPQYHCILLEDYLDLFALTAEHADLFEPAVNIALGDTIYAALRVVAALQTPDDGMPLFNDSANGGAARPSRIMQRAHALGFAPAPIAQPLVALPDTGLYGWKTERDYFLIDCGDIGPSYQPGHTHCDFLSYVLMLDGHWLIVDSGVCEYEPGPLRTYVRSTAAHNTVTVAGAEQSEVWGEFRVGRRAKALHAAIVRTGDQVVFEGGFRGFARLRGGIEHHRRARLELAGDGSIGRLAIADTLRGPPAAPMRSFIHLHPDIEAVVEGHTATLHRGATVVATVQANGVDTLEIGQGWYCPEFGLKQANTVLILGKTDPVARGFGYDIQVAGR